MFSENLKSARKEAELNQNELAERIGVYQKDVSGWERGEISPSLEKFTSICKALNVSADTLLELDK